MQIMIDRLPADVSENDIRELLQEIGLSHPFEVTLAPGLGQHPVALVHLEADHAIIEALVGEIDGRFWNGKTLSASHTTFF